ncbi:HNH endonuclease [Rhizobium leguminosarum]|uniref:HNH endonuclease n=1 Tax=Rhizobium leguminosarum TaxID=384 RepID=UPI00103250F4|nr:HNH endonuclease [Rhizobium leguminosarum]
MANGIQKLRREAFVRQGGLCFYCNCPMVDGDTRSFRKCTAEHLVARSDGGSNNASNVVAACRYCNQTRHKRKQPLSPEHFRKMVQKRLDVGRWHGISRRRAKGP